MEKKPHSGERRKPLPEAAPAKAKRKPLPEVAPAQVKKPAQEKPAPAKAKRKPSPEAAPAKAKRKPSPEAAPAKAKKPVQSTKKQVPAKARKPRKPAPRRKRRLWPSLVLLLAVLSALVLLRCSSREDDLRGAWALDDTTVYKFDGRGRGALRLPLGSSEFSYTLKNGQLSIDFADEAIHDTAYLYIRDGDTLTLDSGTGAIYRLSPAEGEN